MWTDYPIPQEKKESRVIKEQCISVYGWNMGVGGGVQDIEGEGKLSIKQLNNGAGLDHT